MRETSIRLTRLWETGWHLLASGFRRNITLELAPDQSRFATKDAYSHLLPSEKDVIKDFYDQMASKKGGDSDIDDDDLEDWYVLCQKAGLRRANLRKNGISPVMTPFIDTLLKDERS